jgi:hypothetical protein
MAMLVRRGFRPLRARLDLPFDLGRPNEELDEIALLLAHYSARLFLRGAIQKKEGFFPEELTRYLEPSQAL